MKPGSRASPHYGQDADPYALAEAYDNEIVQGVPRWRLEELGRKHADDDGVIEDEYALDEPEDEDEEIEEEE